MDDTIFALSSGPAPAAIGLIRVSGPDAAKACVALAGALPDPRMASLRTLRSAEGTVLDRALALWFPGPATATGEDLLELHCHGGRAVIAAVTQALGELEGLRQAEPGEFTRRAFANGRLDLAEAEALSDLLTAETELQRQVAQTGFGGALSRQVERWRDDVLGLSALVESALDFSDEDDVSELPARFYEGLARFRAELAESLARPSAERLRDGVRVVLAGPPNSGKSSLFNALIDESAAIVSATEGTTRDFIERPVALGGVPLILVDTAGVRETTSDDIEALGIARSRNQMDRADIVLWLGPQGEGPAGGIEVESLSDTRSVRVKGDAAILVSSVTGVGLDALTARIVAEARSLLPKPGQAALNERQRNLLGEALGDLDFLTEERDLLLVGEGLRRVRIAFDRLLGRASTEDMLDTLFGRFCIGK